MRLWRKFYVSASGIVPLSNTRMYVSAKLIPERTKANVARILCASTMAASFLWRKKRSGLKDRFFCSAPRVTRESVRSMTRVCAMRLLVSHSTARTAVDALRQLMWSGFFHKYVNASFKWHACTILVTSGSCSFYSLPRWNLVDCAATQSLSASWLVAYSYVTAPTARDASNAMIMWAMGRLISTPANERSAVRVRSLRLLGEEHLFWLFSRGGPLAREKMACVEAGSRARSVCL